MSCFTLFLVYRWFSNSQLEFLQLLSTPIKCLKTMRSQMRKVVIPSNKSYEFIQLSDILRCEGLQNYTKVFLTNGKMIVSSINIGHFKDNLTAQGFYCCHRSHVINELHMLRYHKDGRLEMRDNSIVPVSRRKKEEFLKILEMNYNILDSDLKQEIKTIELKQLTIDKKIN